MKNSFILFFALVCYSGFAQQFRVDWKDIPEHWCEKLHTLGQDGLSILSEEEGLFLADYFKQEGQSLDLKGKKIAFIVSVSKTDKARFFESVRYRYFEDNSSVSSTLYVFDENQKEQTGGYDGAIVFWSKRLLKPKKVVSILEASSRVN